MTFNIYDYDSHEKEVNLPCELSDIDLILCNVVSGDEVIIILYKNGSMARIDSSNCRIINYTDGQYIIYSEKLKINLFENEEWVYTCDSYDRLFIGRENEI